MKINHKIYSILLVLVVFLGSCTKDFITINPESQWKLDDYYKTEAQMDIAFGGMYGTLRSPNIFGQSLSVTMVYGTDEGYYGPSWDQKWPNSLYVNNTLDGETAKLWTSLYAIVNNANNMIKYMDPANFEEEQYNKYLAEAKFLRGFAYLTLTQWWNEIPLRDQPTVDQNDNHKALSSLEEVYNFIIEDLEFASQNLPNVTDGDFIAGRAHKNSAHGMLARLYMKMGGFPYNDKAAFQLAMNHCDTIINHGYHKLRTDSDTLGYRNLFLDVISGKRYDLQENLFEITFTNNLDIGMATMGTHGNYNGLFFAKKVGSEHPTTKSFTTPSPVFNLVYTDTDKRKEWNVPGLMYLGSDKINVAASPLSWGYTPGKFRRWEPSDYEMVGTGEKTSYVLLTGESTISVNQTPINFPVLRYADVLLMYAEAANEVNGAPTTEALASLNEVRNRAGLEDFTATSYEEFFNEIMDERLRELAFEGIRKHDLIRWGKLGETIEYLGEVIKGEPDYNPATPSHISYLRCVNYFDETKHLSLPYPFQEVTINDKLDQKPEWE